MEHHIHNSIGLLLLAAMVGQYVGWKFKIPSIVIFIIFGVLIGPVFGLMHPQEELGESFNTFIEFAVVILLFEGGLNLKFKELKEVSFGVKRLTTAGVVVNFFIAFYAGQYIAGLSRPISAVIAAILVVTGPTVIIPLLRQAKLPKRISQYLKWEGIINDPLGVLLVTLVYQYITVAGQDGAFEFVAFALFKAIAFSIIITFVFGRSIQFIFDRTDFPDFLKVPFILSIILMIFIISKQVQDGSGLLAVTMLGMYFANKGLLVFTDLKKFKEAISVFSVSIIFILLSASIKLKFFSELNIRQILFILFLTLFCRLIAIFLVTFYSKMTIQERIFVGWVGPRGIVAASVAGIIGLRLSNLGYENADMILPIVFSVVICTVLVHGLSLSTVAKKLGLNVKCGKGLVIVGASPWATDLAIELKEIEVNTLIIDSAWYKLKTPRQLGIETFFGEAISALEEGNIDLTEYSYLLSATDSNSYNALVCSNFSEDLGLNNVYQIPLGNEHDSVIEDLPNSMTGQIVDTEINNVYKGNIKELFNQGWSFKKTHLSEEYKIENFHADNSPAKTINLLKVDKDKSINFITDSQKLNTKPGDIIISFSKD
jgi:NhaP-type Na+/H+ or K+/H+ antiporter